MITAFLLASSLLFCGVKATYDDMNDEDFALFVEAHAKAGEAIAEHAEPVARGCVKGIAAGAVVGKGFQALCLGCVAGAAGELAVDLTFPKGKKEN